MRARSVVFLAALFLAGTARGEEAVLVPAGVLHEPFGVGFLPAGGMIIVEMEHGNRVLKVDAAGMQEVLAGTGTKGFAGDGGPARQAQFNGLHNLAIAPNGDIYLADAFNFRVRKIDARTGTISTFAGTGVKGFSGDAGPAAQAQFGTVIQVALDPPGTHLYVADIDNQRVRRVVLATGIVETVAGDGRQGAPAEGADARTAPLLDPRAVAVAPDGSLYILERGGNALLRVDAAGKIQTLIAAGAHALNGPKHLCLDRDGNVFIADTESHVIRRFTPGDGRLVPVAGTGKAGAAGVGGDPLQCELSRPHGVTFGPDGTLYITDSYNDRILRITR
jgi:DNA-binding beta-propeller fold protein YncE